MPKKLKKSKATKEVLVMLKQLLEGNEGQDGDNDSSSDEGDKKVAAKETQKQGVPPQVNIPTQKPQNVCEDVEGSVTGTVKTGGEASMVAHSPGMRKVMVAKSALTKPRTIKVADDESKHSAAASATGSIAARTRNKMTEAISDYNPKRRKPQIAEENSKRLRMSTSFYHNEMEQPGISTQPSGDSVVMVDSKDDDMDEPLMIPEDVTGEK